MRADWEAAKTIADLIWKVSGQLIIGDEMRDRMIAIIAEARVEGFKAGQEAMRERAAAEHDSMAKFYNQQASDAMRRLNELLPGHADGFIADAKRHRDHAEHIRSLLIREPE